MKNFLLSIDVSSNLNISLDIRECGTNKLINFSLEDQAKWKENQYAWFKISGVAGGCDTYLQRVDELVLEIWKEELKTNSNAQKIESLIEKSLEIGYYWTLRRSVGQPPIINLSYGLIAASIAFLTNGFIFSDDGAWEYCKFPCRSEEFLSFYFRPELSRNEIDIVWSLECINDIKKLFRKEV